MCINWNYTRVELNPINMLPCVMIIMYADESLKVYIHNVPIFYCRNMMNFNVTVLEYRNSSFLSLSVGDLDQLLQNTAMEECTLSVDTLIGKALEIDLAASSTRITRDLSKSSMSHCMYMCV